MATEREGIKVDSNGMAPEKLAAMLAAFEPASILKDDQIAELISQSVVEEIPQGEQLFDDGIPTELVVYLLQGSIEFTSSNGGIKQLESGSEDARRPVAYDHSQKPPLMVAATPISILCVDKELLDTMVSWAQISAPETEVIMSEEGIVTIDRASWLNSMIKSPTFRKLPAANIEQLLNKLDPVRVNAGDLIIRQGDQGDYFYMINNGIALVTINPENDEDSVIMAELNEGASFGEAALISDKPRNATITMMEDGVLLRLSKEDFINLLKQPTLRWVEYGKTASIIKRGAMWIDVRMPEEYERGHLPNSINIPMRELHKSARDLRRDIPYICCCESGTRSSAAAFALSQYKIRTAVLKGGIESVPEEDLELSSATV